MSKKYERNFIIKSLPDNFEDWEKCTLKQWFVSNKNDNTKLRFRLYDDNKCYMDIKKDTDRESYDKGIKCKYDDIKFLLDGIQHTEKDRYKYRMDNYLFTIDIFDDGTKIFEIESKDKNTVDNFIPYDWLGNEIFNL
jgi:CYTH domain-containing protein